MVDAFQLAGHDAVLFVMVLQIDDFHARPEGVVDEGRPQKAQLVAAVEGGEHGAVEGDHRIDDGKHEAALNKTLAVDRLLGMLNVGMQFKPVPGKHAEINDIGFRHRSPARHAGLAQ